MDSLTLINWRLVGFASLWIIGLAIILTIFGVVHFYANAEYRRTVEILKRPIYQAVINAGLMLFCIGKSGGSDNWIKSILWILLAIGFAVHLFAAWREIRQSK